MVSPEAFAVIGQRMDSWFERGPLSVREEFTRPLDVLKQRVQQGGAPTPAPEQSATKTAVSVEDYQRLQDRLAKVEAELKASRSVGDKRHQPQQSHGGGKSKRRRKSPAQPYLRVQLGEPTRRVESAAEALREGWANRENRPPAGTLEPAPPKTQTPVSACCAHQPVTTVSKAPASYVTAVETPPREVPDRTPKPLYGLDSPIVVIGDSNFTKYPFTRAPWSTLSRGGLRFQWAKDIALGQQLNPRRVKAVILGIGINETSGVSEDRLRKQMGELKEALQEVYPEAPVFHVQAPAEKLKGENQARVKRANAIARDVFRHISIASYTTGTGNPHYTNAERQNVARGILRVLRQEVPDLARLPV